MENELRISPRQILLQKCMKSNNRTTVQNMAGVINSHSYNPQYNYK